MAIRLRQIDGRWKALCAAESEPQADDLYLHDGLHDALANKFLEDWTRSGLIPPKPRPTALPSHKHGGSNEQH